MAPENPLPGPWEEHRHPDGTVRALYQPLLDALAAVDLDQLTASVERWMTEHGVGFGEQPFVVDPIPRLIAADEWATVELGLAQRTRALNAFLRDVYADRRIVDAGIVANDTIEEAEGYEPDLQGRLPDGCTPAAIIGFDLVRDPEGRFLVLEDNLRTPSGIAYLAAARGAVANALPGELRRPRPVDPLIYELLGATLRAAAPTAAGDDPVIVVVTDGPGNVAHYEHGQIAQSLGLPLVTPAQLRTGDQGLAYVDDDGDGGAGDGHHIDVVYRRTDEDRVRDEHGAMTPIAQLLTPAWLQGTIGLVNAFGNGVADDKLVHRHVEDFVRFYLEEEPLIASVPTRALDTPEAARQAIERLPELVIKPRHGHGGTGVTIGSHAGEAELTSARKELEKHSARYIAQPIVPLSQHPTVIDGRLEPRHLDLRPFAFVAQDVALVPGGLSRVAFDAGEMVVNSSRNGGGKDTWVMD